MWSSGRGEFTGCTSRFWKYNIPGNKEDMPGFYTCVPVAQVVTLMFSDTRSLQVEADRPPPPAALHNVPHPAPRMAQRSNDVGRKNQLRALEPRRTVGNLIEIISRRWRERRGWRGAGAVYIFVASPGPRKSAVAIVTFALRWLALTRYVVIKMSYPPALEGWHNCVQTQSLLHSYREPNRLPYIMGCKICFFFPQSILLFLPRNGRRDTFYSLQEKNDAGWHEVDVNFVWSVQ